MTTVFRWIYTIASHRLTYVMASLLFCIQCYHVENNTDNVSGSLQVFMKDVPFISGRREYLASPYVTAGDRLYMVGQQDGTFPDMGWHVKGEMGGIWDHPIKLMDGFTSAVLIEGQAYCLSKADSFINYPFANKLVYTSAVPGLRVERFQFVPDGKEAVVVEYRFTNKALRAINLTFEFIATTDLRPVWLGERTGLKDGKDAVQWMSGSQCMVVKDSLNDWFAVWGTQLKSTEYRFGENNCAVKHQGLGVNAATTYSLKIDGGQSMSLPFFITGSYVSLDSALKTLEDARNQAPSWLKKKRDRYDNMTKVARLHIPDKTLEQAYQWARYNVDWLIRDVPEIGRGLSAGMPDYPWWFGCDNTYALQGMLATGHVEIVYSTMRLLKMLSEKVNGNGRIVHEASTNGAVFNPGNVNETAQFISLVWSVYKWTGDRNFLTEFYPTVKKGLSWLLDENDRDHNLLPDGFGMMEIHGLNGEMIDVAAYTQRAFSDAVNIAKVFKDDALATKYKRIAGKLSEKINSDFWVPGSGSYADFISTPSQAKQLIDGAVIRADTLKKPWAVKELEEARVNIGNNPSAQKMGFVVYHNWVVNTPMETGVADTAKALQALRTGARFTNPFGVFVTGIDRDETAGTNEDSFAKGKKSFSYVGAVMTLPTGVQAIAENNYGHPDLALDYLKRLTNSFSYALPGSMYEVSPDFGMMTQAWTLYGLAVPIIEQFFGFDPNAYEETVYLHPQMPTQWQEATLENVIVANNKLSLAYKRKGSSVQLVLDQSDPEWKIVLRLPKDKYVQWEIDGRPINPQSDGNVDRVSTNGRHIEIDLISATQD
jgi:glycogen debranching enzyme